MKIVLLLLFLIFLHNLPTKAQLEKRDYVWIIGYDVDGTPEGAGTKLDFNHDSLEVSFIEKPMWFSSSSISICDKDGALLFYSNGCYVAEATHQPMPGSEVLSPGIVEEEYCPYGGLQIQGLIALPHMEQEYYLIGYQFELLFEFATIKGTSITYSVIDMSSNNGFGELIEKNTVVLQDTFPRSYLHAIQHANGRDWWVIAPKAVSNCYHKLLLDNAGLHYVEKQCIGNEWNYQDWAGQAVFSPDGEKYIRFNAYNGLNIFDFDRCNGELSNPVQVRIPGAYTSGGVGVSPNSRYLYASASDSLFQLDLWAPDIQESLTFIEAFDGQPFPYYSNFYLQQLAPDGKIYIGGTGTHKHLHIIHQPDSAGLACNFQQHGLPLPSFNYISMPNLPHFNMGSTNEPCDWVLNKVIEPYPASSSFLVTLFPNPAINNFMVTFDRPLPEDGQLVLYNSMGIKYGQFGLGSGAREASFDINGWHAGVYFYEIRTAARHIGTGKLLIRK